MVSSAANVSAAPSEMKILQVHNYYQQRGGEDSVFHSEYELLQKHGHQVFRYTAHNNAVDHMSRLRAAWTTVWNTSSYREVRAILAEQSIDVIHAHNTFPLISPSIYYAAQAARVPVIQTLHNYRLLCPGSTLFREGKICEECIGKIPVRGVMHGCYRDNKAASAVVAGMLTAHRAIGTWRSKVHTYIALTSFARDIFVRAGLPAQRVTVKPNCLPQDPGPGNGQGGFALFAGRLSPEKGIRELLEAWALLPRLFPLKIAGDGTMRQWVRDRAASIPGVEYIGPRSHEQVISMIKDATFVVLPSSWYEGLPMTIVEAFACGTPVITSRLPSMDDLVQHGVNGRRFVAGDAADLAHEANEFLQQPGRWSLMRAAARASYEGNFSPEQNYSVLRAIYDRAVASYAGETIPERDGLSAILSTREKFSNDGLIQIQKQ